MKKIALILLFPLLFVGCSQLNKINTTPGIKKAVDATTGNISLHPVDISIKSKEAQYFFFLDAQNKILFVTDDPKIYQSIASYLPEVIIPGRFVLLQGTFIDPFTIFTKEEFEQLNSKMSKMGIKLNEWKVARLFNYGMMFDDHALQGTIDRNPSDDGSLQIPMQSRPAPQQPQRQYFPPPGSYRKNGNQ